MPKTKRDAQEASGNLAEVRDRILETASALFYRQGVRAVGVDLVVEQAGVAKTSLYRHFHTKDDLIAAFPAAPGDEGFLVLMGPRRRAAIRAMRRPRARRRISHGSASASRGRIIAAARSSMSPPNFRTPSTRPARWPRRISRSCGGASKSIAERLRCQASGLALAGAVVAAHQWHAFVRAPAAALGR